MSTQPDMILDWARAMLSFDRNDEVHCRAVVSRAYYASFHRASKSFPSSGGNPTEGVHVSLIAKIKLSTPAHGSGYTDFVGLRSKMEMLKKLRIKADYKLYESLRFNVAQDALLTAEKIFQHCEALDSKKPQPGTDAINGTISTV